MVQILALGFVCCWFLQQEPSVEKTLAQWIIFFVTFKQSCYVGRWLLVAHRKAIVTYKITGCFLFYLLNYNIRLLCLLCISFLFSGPHKPRSVWAAKARCLCCLNNFYTFLLLFASAWTDCNAFRNIILTAWSGRTVSICCHGVL